jgi:hypothetical protein
MGLPNLQPERRLAPLFVSLAYAGLVSPQRLRQTALFSGSTYLLAGGFMRWARLPAVQR